MTKAGVIKGIFSIESLFENVVVDSKNYGISLINCDWKIFFDRKLSTSMLS